MKTVTTNDPMPSRERLVADPRLRRIERDHALLGAAAIASTLAFAPQGVTSVAFGWALMASSLWLWKRVALALFAGGPNARQAFAVRLMLKTTLSLPVLIAAVLLIELHVPLVLRVPGLAPHAVAETVSLIDLAPSLLEILEAPVPETMQGTARLAELVSPRTEEAAGEAYVGMDEDGMFALVRGDTKLVRHWLDEQPWRVYDLAADPGEHVDRYAPREHAPLVERLACYREVLAHSHGHPPVPAITDGLDEERLRALGYLVE